MSTRYKVVLHGVAGGCDTAEVAVTLAGRFGVPAEKIRSLLLTPGVTVRRGVDLQTAVTYQAALEDAGCDSVVEPEDVPNPASDRASLGTEPRESSDLLRIATGASLNSSTDSSARGLEPASPLMTCEACGNALARTATACPKCGATNSWRARRIRELVEWLPDASVGARFEFWHDDFKVWGRAKEGCIDLVGLPWAVLIVLSAVYVLMLMLGGTALGQALTLTVPGVSLVFLWCAMLLPYLLGLGFIWAMLSTAKTVLTHDTRDRAAGFLVDYSAHQPIWRSSDDELWQPIKAFVERQAN